MARSETTSLRPARMASRTSSSQTKSSGGPATPADVEGSGTDPGEGAEQNGRHGTDVKRQRFIGARRDKQAETGGVEQQDRAAQLIDQGIPEEGDHCLSPIPHRPAESGAYVLASTAMKARFGPPL